jgi:hypothetical protein
VTHPYGNQLLGRCYETKWKPADPYIEEDEEALSLFKQDHSEFISPLLELTKGKYQETPPAKKTIGLLGKLAIF